MSKKNRNDLFMRVYFDMFSKGLAASLGPKRLMTLLTIASYMNESGDCFPTQEQIARRMGVSTKTAYTYITELITFRWNDQPIIQRLKRYIPGKGPQEQSFYTVLPISQVAVFNGSIQPLPEINTADSPVLPVRDRKKLQVRSGKTLRLRKGNMLRLRRSKTLQVRSRKGLRCNNNHYNNNHLNNNQLEAGQTARMTVEKRTTESFGPKEVISYFSQKYRERYSVNFSVNWSRDMLLAKRLLNDFTADQIRTIINIVFERYDTTWKKDKYPRPSLGQLASWLGNQALALAQEEKTTVEPVKEFGGRDPYVMLEQLKRGGRKVG
ncbi:helix-turn-helix domain-containing protein [Heliobacterium chlorum]|uniref:Helix-turn-helix domain-containing protein n=1 Tax=Heliobacterium chlorum TaxID=2698 RepID=A0ABR7T3Z9_HELCL|nr:helix-turn-helix domain-containing protein [Heliobacterium chlorum]MBC9785492.1 helix-turn-helix domain-containing protein [Heliobacterium chlorum]